MRALVVLALLSNACGPCVEVITVPEATAPVLGPKFAAPCVPTDGHGCSFTLPSDGNPAPVSQLNNLRLMPMGDDFVTDAAAADGNGSYRVEVWTRARADNFFITFVGSNTLGPGGDYLGVGDSSTIGSNKEEGHPGYTIQNLFDSLNSYQQITEFQPDVVSLMIGSQDLLGSYDMGVAESAYTTMLDKVLSDGVGQSRIFGDSVVFVCTLFYQNKSGTHAPNSAVDAFNAFLVTLVATRPRAKLVDTHAALNYPGDFTSGGIYPTTAGNVKYGDAIYNALKAL